MARVVIFLAEGFEEIEAITTIDILRRAELELYTVSVTGNRTVTGSHQIPIITDNLFGEIDFSTIDLLILPGGMPGAKNLDLHEGVKQQLLDFNRSGKWIAAICAAPMVLGHLGILKGKRAVCFPGNENALAGAILSEEPVMSDDHIITSRGAGTAFAFALKITELLVGKDKAYELASKMIAQQQIAN